MAVYMLAVLLGLLVLGESAYGQESALPMKYNPTTLQGDAGQVCPPTDQRDAANVIRSLIRTTVLPAIQNGACGCGGPGWRRIAYLNMTDPTHSCPLYLITTPKRTCGKSIGSGCYPINFGNIGSLQYSQVCGRIISYQYGHIDGFASGSNRIDSYYIDGVSLTHGSQRKHIWSFVAALDETRKDHKVCPCTNINNPFNLSSFIPSFVGDDYFCETGVPPGSGYESGTFYADDPLWDGDGCGPTSNCCTFNNPPWFCKQLPQPTTDNLEVRLCSGSGENIPIELIEVYVK